MGVYEITTTGGKYRITTADPAGPAPAAPEASFGSRFKSNLVAAANTAFPFADEGAAAVRSVLPGYGSYDAELAAIRQGEQQHAAENPYEAGWSGAVGALSTAPFLPSAVGKAPTLLTKAGTAAAEGAAYGGFYGFGNAENGFQERVKAGLSEAKTGAVFSAGLVGAGQGAKRLASAASNAGRKMELRAFGVGKNQINKAIRRMPEVLDERGNFQNPISEAIESFRADGGATRMDPAALLDDLNQQTDSYIGKLTTELVDAQQKQKDLLIPNFAKTKDYLDGLAGVDRAQAEKIAAEEIANTINATDGTLLSLHKEKVKLGQSITQSSWGQDSAGRLRNNILKRIRADLRVAVEDGYSQVTGKDSSVVHELNNKIGQRESLQGLFNDILATEEAGDLPNALRKSLRTSGGVGQLVIAGAAGTAVGGPLLGATAVAADMYLNTPAGKKALADGLRSSTLQGAANLAERGANYVPRLVGSIGSESAGVHQQQPPYNRSFDSLSRSQDRTSTKSRSASTAPALGGQLPPKLENTQQEQQNLSDLSSSPYSLFNRTSLSESGGKSTLYQDMFGGGMSAETDKEALSQIKSSPYYHALALTESGLDPRAKNPKSTAKGLFQFIDSTAKAVGLDDPYDVTKSWEAVQKFTNDHVEKFGDDPATLYAAHYMGAGLLSKVQRGTKLTAKEQGIVDSFYASALPRFMKKYQKVTAVEV